MQSEEPEDIDQSKIVSSATEMTYTVKKSNSPSTGNKDPALGTDNAKSSQNDIDLSSIDFSKMIPPSQSASSSSASSEVTEECLEVDVKPEVSITLADSEEAVEPIPLNNLQEHNPNESIRNWLLRISKMQTEIQKQIYTENNENQSSLSGSGTKVSNQQFSEFTTKKCATANSGRVVKYQDLPYMGEMTLDNSKPRRGRKPKKADICHLIYKNYGTIFPGTPNSKGLQEFVAKREPELLQNSAGEVYNRSDVQNRIISSLLEKRLTQESKRQKENLLSRRKAQEEPLNLCVRDLDQLKIRLLRKDDVFVSQSALNIKTEPHSDDEVEFVHETPSPQVKGSTPDMPLIPDGIQPVVPTSDNNYVYWSNSGVFIHPLALQQQLMQYQKMASNSNYNLPPPSGQPGLTIVPFPQPLLPADVPPSPDNSTNSNSSELRKLVPKVRTIKIRDPTKADKISSKRNSVPNCDKQQSPTKRKRSAIFIPPIPAENQTNPATEVSICKFKFTGGAKPTLQEKKMLSVDAGGNFRYYSGTGDKSMRGYEFFPRETLQQHVGNAHGSSTGAFLKASGEKIYPINGSPDNMTDVAGKAVLNEFMRTPELPSSSVIPPLVSTSSDNPNNSNQFKHRSSTSNSCSANNKRKSRKSLQREKLEQTFKEKGFLIQTQQLESAEGATYCKFRQLRKFTRYLFRSWKDYLPNGGAAEATPGGSGVQVDRPDVLEDTGSTMLSEVDMESLSKMSRSSTASSSEIMSPSPSQT